MQPASRCLRFSVALALIAATVAVPAGRTFAAACVSPPGDTRPCRCFTRATPTSGPPGSRVRVTGVCTGILYHRPVYVHFDVVGVASFDGVGEDYSIEFTVPPRAQPGRHQISVVAPFAQAMTSFEVTGPPPQCVGDCNLDRAVSVSELVSGVGIALGSSDLSKCAPFDLDRDEEISIAELTTATRAALVGCARVERCRDARDCEPPLICRSQDPRIDCRDCDTSLCATDGDCADGEECGDAGRCVGASCIRNDDCPTTHRCIRVSSETDRASQCARSACIFESCDDFCVNERCQESLGTCADPLTLP